MIHRRILLLVVFLATALMPGLYPVSAQTTSPCLPTGPLTTEQLPGGGWVGGTIESFEAIYGKPSKQDALFSEYEIEGCGTVFADSNEGFVTSISLFAPRESEDTDYLLETDDADWEPAYALWIAQSFLPPDAVILVDADLAAIDFFYQNGYSQALMDTVPPSVYEYVMNPPVAYGGFQVVYQRPGGGHEISMITIDLETEQFSFAS